MKYKVGDKVRIKSIDWYNKNKDKYGIVKLSTPVFIPEMLGFCGKVVTIKDVFEDNNGNVMYYMKEIDWCWSDEMIEGLVEEETVLNKWNGLKVELELSKSVIGVSNIESLHGERFMSGFVKAIIPPDGYIFKDESGNVINTNKIVLEKQKKEFPKTYEECAMLLRLGVVNELKYRNLSDVYKKDLIVSIQKLLICRDAYWKIAGEEMGLGKPWEPDWDDDEWPDMYYISWDGKCLEKEKGYPCCNMILIFPTEEMRDAFYDNFKKEIEECKELL